MIELTVKTLAGNSFRGFVFGDPDEIYGSLLFTQGGRPEETIPAAWFDWVKEADKVVAVWAKGRGGRTVRDMHYVLDCFTDHTGLSVDQDTPVRPWFRRKVRGRWEAYWYAPW